MLCLNALCIITLEGNRKKKQMWLKDMCKATAEILRKQKQQQLSDFLLWENLERSRQIIPFCIRFPLCVITHTLHHVEEREQVSLDQGVDEEPLGPPPTEA